MVQLPQSHSASNVIHFNVKLLDYFSFSPLHSELYCDLFNFLQKKPQKTAQKIIFYLPTAVCSSCTLIADQTGDKDQSTAVKHIAEASQNTLWLLTSVFRVSLRDLGARWTSVPGLVWQQNGRPTQYWQGVIVLFCFCVVLLIDVKKLAGSCNGKMNHEPPLCCATEKLQRTSINKWQRRVRQQHCTIVAEQCSQHSGMGILCESAGSWLFRPLLNILATPKLCKQNLYSDWIL